MAEMRQLHENPATRMEKFRAWRFRAYERIGLMRGIRAEQEAMKGKRVGLTQLGDEELLQRGMELRKKSDSSVTRSSLWGIGLALGSAGSMGMAFNLFMNSTQKLLGGVFAALCVGLACAADIMIRRGDVKADTISDEFSIVLHEQIRRSPSGRQRGQLEEKPELLN